MKAIILARVSKEEQKEAGNSPPAQIARLKKYCQSKQYEIVKEFSFDESAYKSQRNIFDKRLLSDWLGGCYIGFATQNRHFAPIGQLQNLFRG